MEAKLQVQRERIIKRHREQRERDETHSKNVLIALLLRLLSRCMDIKLQEEQETEGKQQVQNMTL